MLKKAGGVTISFLTLPKLLLPNSLKYWPGELHMHTTVPLEDQGRVLLYSECFLNPSLTNHTSKLHG